MKDHPGFAAVARAVAKHMGVPLDKAKAVVAAGAKAAAQKSAPATKPSAAKKPQPY